MAFLVRFQHTAARRRLFFLVAPNATDALFQHTAARRRLVCRVLNRQSLACFNTQPPEGGCPASDIPSGRNRVSTHSRPKAAVLRQCSCYYLDKVSTHSRPKAAVRCEVQIDSFLRFQHTAARRRLRVMAAIFILSCRFNTQPPEGGCTASPSIKCEVIVSTHSRPKAAAQQMRALANTQ